ncbi:MAG: hypothetical protein RsTaC01_0459 [Candidatus Paraimprobicoccus trichonymphae]|uniref:Uncharacterized protein n=1 Tax=Candidatus Paraimprobicoccus trichonymphae TaxID=3033793 RepID=A0AA48HWB7_9FIRM|nr:MAG: hypothetical protein RsTaC01_0459 [Candidatus Paraimprobicoccus trichonymphae]
MVTTLFEATLFVGHLINKNYHNKKEDINSTLGFKPESNKKSFEEKEKFVSEYTITENALKDKEGHVICKYEKKTNNEITVSTVYWNVKNKLPGRIGEKIFSHSCFGELLKIIKNELDKKGTVSFRIKEIVFISYEEKIEKFVSQIAVTTYSECTRWTFSSQEVPVNTSCIEEITFSNCYPVAYCKAEYLSEILNDLSTYAFPLHILENLKQVNFSENCKDTIPEAIQCFAVKQSQLQLSELSVNLLDNSGKKSHLRRINMLDDVKVIFYSI